MARQRKRRADDKVIPAWEAKPLILRAYDCKMLLAVYGFITTAESRKIERRLLKAAGVKP